MLHIRAFWDNMLDFCDVIRTASSFREQLLNQEKSVTISSQGSNSGPCLKTVCPDPWICKIEEEQCDLQTEQMCTCVQRHFECEITQTFRRQPRKTAIPHELSKLQCYINEETFCQWIATILSAQTAIHQNHFILQCTFWYIIKRTVNIVCFYNHSGLRTLYALAMKIKQEQFRKFVDMHLRLFVECVYSS